MSFLERILANDLEFRHRQDLIHRGMASRSLSWTLKHLLKSRLRVLPGFVLLEDVAYWLLHKFRLPHCLQLANNFFFKKHIYLSFQNGFGDMLEAYPYFRVLKQRFPKHKVFAVIHAPSQCRFAAMSFCKESLVRLKDGRSFDYVREFIETNPHIDGIVHDDCWGDGYIYAWPRLLATLLGNHFTHASFAHDAHTLFSADDKATGEAWMRAANLRAGEFVAVHFKTAVPFLSNLVRRIAEQSKEEPANSQRLQFLFFGSPQPALADELRSQGFEILSLSGSYEQGISTRQLIYIAKHARLFLGGRGGFNAIYYLLGIPTLNVFDAQGRQELSNGLWPENLWKDNPVGQLIWESDDLEDTFQTCVRPFLALKDSAHA